MKIINRFHKKKIILKQKSLNVENLLDYLSSRKILSISSNCNNLN